MCSRGHAFQEAMHGRGMHCRGGVHGRGHAWQGACVVHTVNELAVRILLECILVSYTYALFVDQDGFPGNPSLLDWKGKTRIDSGRKSLGVILNGFEHFYLYPFSEKEPRIQMCRGPTPFTWHVNDHDCHSSTVPFKATNLCDVAIDNCSNTASESEFILSSLSLLNVNSMLDSVRTHVQWTVMFVWIDLNALGTHGCRCIRTVWVSL